MVERRRRESRAAASRRRTEPEQRRSRGSDGQRAPEAAAPLAPARPERACPNTITSLTTKHGADRRPFLISVCSSASPVSPRAWPSRTTAPGRPPAALFLALFLAAAARRRTQYELLLQSPPQAREKTGDWKSLETV